MATIKVWTKDVGNRGKVDANGQPKMGGVDRVLDLVKDPQHLYLIYTDDVGRSTILRGGPSGNPLGIGKSDVLVDKEPYNQRVVEVDRRGTTIETPDWNDGTHFGAVVYEGREADVLAKWNPMVKESKQLNAEGLDYEALTQNSNTAVQRMAEAAGLGDQVDAFVDALKLNVPGYDKTVNSGPVQLEGLFGPGSQFHRDVNGALSLTVDDITTIGNPYLLSHIATVYKGQPIAITTPTQTITYTVFDDSNGERFKAINDTVAHDRGAVIKVGNSLLVDESATVELANGRQMQLGDLMDAVEPSTTSLLDTVATAAQHLGQRLFNQASIAEVVQRLASGQDVDEIALDMVVQRSAQWGVDEVAAGLNIEAGTLAHHVADGFAKYATTVLVHNALHGALTPEEYEAVAKSVIIRETVQTMAMKYGTEYGLTQSAQYGLSSGAEGSAGLSPVGAGVVAAAVYTLDYLANNGSPETAEEWEGMVATAGGTAAAATIGAAIGSAIGGPVGTVVGMAVGTILGAPLTNKFSRDWDNMKDTYNDTLAAFNDTWNGETDIANGAFELAKESVQFGLDQINSAGRLVGEVFDSAGGFLHSDNAQGLDQIAGDYTSEYYKNINDVWNGKKDIVRGIADYVNSSVQAVFDVVENVGTFVGDIFSGIGSFVGGLFGGGGGSLPDPPKLDRVESTASGAQIVYSKQGGRNVISRDSFDDEAVGTHSSETLAGSDGNNKLYGFGGDDFLQGRAGDDELYGGAGDDILSGGSGDDTAVGDAGDDWLVGDAGDDVLVGGEGNDRMYGDQEMSGQPVQAGADTLDAGAGDDVVYAGGGDDSIIGGSGMDQIHGEAGHDSIDAGAGDDRVDGGAGNDVISGGDGADSGHDQLFGGAGDDQLFGYSGDDVLDGGSGDDVLVAGYGHDRIIGGAGHDTIFGDADGANAPGNHGLGHWINGNDTIDAGDGNDRVHVIEGVDTVYLGAGDDRLESIMSTVTGRGGIGNDTLIAHGGTAVFDGEAGDDILTTGSGDDRLDGGAGNDTLTAGLGDDSLDGGSGNDILSAEGGNNQFDGGSGDDVIIAGAGNDTIRTGTGSDVVLAGSGDDTITITSTAGTKTDVTGGAGNDTYIIDQLDGDVVIEDAGQSQDVDTLVFDKKHLSGVNVQKSDQDLLIRFSGLAGVVTVKNYFVEDQQSRVEALQFGDTKLSIVSLLEASTETLSSSTNNLAVVGTEEDDVMISGSGDDVLSGNEGDDTLIGGQGDDILTGGSGHDRFVMGPDGGHDTLTDFESGSDTLDMTGYSASFASMKGMTYFSNGITQNGNDVQVALNDGATITLEDQTVDRVNQAANFVFDLADQEHATDGNDRLVGTSANDQLVGGKGHDVLTGGAGSDTFTITKHAGDIDTVTDFNVAEDTLDMTQMDEYIDYLQLDVSQKNGDTVISTDDQHIILENVKTKELLEKNFKFAMFDGMPEVQRYQGPVNYDFSLDDTVEADTEFLGQFGANIDPQLFEEAIQSGIDFNNTNFDTVDNAFNEGVTHVLSNNEYWKKVGGKRKRWELQRDTTFNGSNEGWRYTGGKWRRKSHYENGNDRMYGAWWSETINAGSGNDEVYAGNGNDTVNGGSGNDYLDGQDGNDTLNGGSGHDYLLGGRGDDQLNGGTGNDYLDGGQGNDTMHGGDGSDKIVDLEGDNLLSGQHGNDHLISGDGNDTLYGGQGNDHLVAGGGDDVLNGDYDIVSYTYRVKKTYSYGWGKWRRTYTRWETRTGYKENDQYGNDILDAGAGDDLVIDKGGDNVVDLGDGNDKAILGIGNDTIDGGTGDDHITAGAGNDTIHTGSDDDYAQADAGNDLVEATDGLNWLHGGSGNDKLIGGVDHDIIYGGSGDDIIEGNDGSDLIVAGTNDDTVSGGDGADDISLGQGDDTATGDAGDDLIKGEDGQDTIDGGDGHDSISGGQGADRIKGGAGNDRLSGDEGDDVIDGQDGSDFLYGGDGNDRLIAGEGKNILRGDAGDDIYVFNRDDRFRDIVIGFEAGDKIDLSSYTEYVSLRQIQRDSLAIFNAQMLKLSNGNQIAFKDSQVDELQESNFILNTIEGSTEVTDEEKTDESTGYLQTAGFFSYDAPDSVTESNWLSDNSLQTEGGLSLNVKKFSIAQSGNAWNNTIAGHDGAEWLLGGGGDDWIDGQGGSDIIDGGTGSDSIYGGAGNDIVSAGAGNDLVYGGEGNDMLTGNDGNDILSGEAGDDVIHGNNDHDFISGGEGNDELYGDAGNDFIEGNNGNDTIFGGDGNDLVYAGLGNDTINLGSGNDFVSGGGGRDRMYGQSGDDSLHGDAGHDALFGGDGNDTLDGGDHNDIVKGDQGNDVLAGGRGSDLLYDGDGHDTVNGGDGDDVLFIGNGSDRLSGGQGRDIFSFESLASSTETDWDILLDFTSGDDKIDLSTVGIESMADLSMTSEGGDTIVASAALDVDFMFKLSGVHRLTDDDFVFAAQA